MIAFFAELADLHCSVGHPSQNRSCDSACLASLAVSSLDNTALPLGWRRSRAVGALANTVLTRAGNGQSTTQFDCKACDLDPILIFEPVCCFLAAHLSRDCSEVPTGVLTVNCQLWRISTRGTCRSCSASEAADQPQAFTHSITMARDGAPALCLLLCRLHKSAY